MTVWKHWKEIKILYPNLSFKLRGFSLTAYSKNRKNILCECSYALIADARFKIKNIF